MKSGSDTTRVELFRRAVIELDCQSTHPTSVIRGQLGVEAPGRQARSSTTTAKANCGLFVVVIQHGERLIPGVLESSSGQSVTQVLRVPLKSMPLFRDVRKLRILHDMTIIPY